MVNTAACCRMWFIRIDATDAIQVVGYFNIEGDVLGMTWMSEAKAPMLLLSLASGMLEGMTPDFTKPTAGQLIKPEALNPRFFCIASHTRIRPDSCALGTLHAVELLLAFSTNQCTLLAIARYLDFILNLTGNRNQQSATAVTAAIHAPACLNCIVVA